jgi:hypothetical protein
MKIRINNHKLIKLNKIQLILKVKILKTQKIRLIKKIPLKNKI